MPGDIFFSKLNKCHVLGERRFDQKPMKKVLIVLLGTQPLVQTDNNGNPQLCGNIYKEESND